MRTNRVDQAVLRPAEERHGVQWLVELTAAAELFRLPLRHGQRLRDRRRRPTATNCRADASRPSQPGGRGRARTDPCRPGLRQRQDPGYGGPAATPPPPRHTAAAAKAGPGFHRPDFHAAASGSAVPEPRCLGDAPSHPRRAHPELKASAEFVLCEGVMGLFDGTGADGETGSTDELARVPGGRSCWSSMPAARAHRSRPACAGSPITAGHFARRGNLQSRLGRAPSSLVHAGAAARHCPASLFSAR